MKVRRKEGDTRNFMIRKGERKGKKGKGVCVKIRGERGWKVEKNERVTIETREKGIKASIYRGSG